MARCRSTADNPVCVEGRVICHLKQTKITGTEFCAPACRRFHQNERESGYRRQYVVVALANQMAAGSVVVSKICKPDAEESKEMVHLSEAINKKLTNVMQGTVQMVSVRDSRSQ